MKHRSSISAITVCVFFATLAKQGAAQQLDMRCVAAQSVIPTGLAAAGLKIEYDKFTDTTKLASKSDNRSLASMTALGWFRGQTPRADSILFAFEYGERQPQLGPSPITQGNAKYNAETTIILLLDARERIPLTTPRYASKLQQGFPGLTGPFLQETLQFPLTWDQLQKIAQSKSVEIKVGRNDTRISDKVLEGARQIAQIAACASR